MMKIDRHNYEEFFILYWDDELTASQKQAVENFVQENADLQEEFKILGDTRFTPDKNVQLEEKEFLLNNSFINITNYEEQLLNYIDDELGTDERKEVERSAAKYPGIQKELALLQKTKLQPEAEVNFPYKSALYRREEKVRVISMTWFRVAVAAVIILIAGFVTIRLVNTKKGGDNTEIVTVDPKDSIAPIDSQVDLQPKQTPDSQASDIAGTNEKSAPAQPGIKKKDQKPVPENKINNTVAIYRDGNKNNLPRERKNIQQNDQNATTDGIIADAGFNIKKDNSTAQKNNSDLVNTSFDKTIVTLQAKPTLHIPGIEDKGKEKDGGGLKELLRKTARVFERRTKIQATTEDNKLLVGAFAVSLK